jgi:hypothetical protein
MKLIVEARSHHKHSNGSIGDRTKIVFMAKIPFYPRIVFLFRFRKIVILQNPLRKYVTAMA